MVINRSAFLCFLALLAPSSSSNDDNTQRAPLRGVGGKVVQDESEESATISSESKVRALQDLTSYQSFFVKDKKHGKCMAGGAGSNDIYHQGCVNAHAQWWTFNPVPGETGFFYMYDTWYKKALIAGDYNDNNVYQQDANGRDNAKWFGAPVYGLEGYIYLIDKKHGEAVCAGNYYDGQVYHQYAGERENCMWKLESAAKSDLPGPDFSLFDFQNFEVRDRKHNYNIVAGWNYDGDVYHQHPASGNSHNQRWIFVPLESNPGFYNIYDMRHYKTLVGGNDNNVYHQHPYNKNNAKWKAVSAGSGYFYLMDMQYNKAICAGSNQDNNIYHQDPNGRWECQWKLMNAQNTEDPAPEFLGIAASNCPGNECVQGSDAGCATGEICSLTEPVTCDPYTFCEKPVTTGTAAGTSARHRCFTGESLIKMQDGSFKPISDIKIGDEVAKGGKVEGLMQFKGVADGSLCRVGPNVVMTPTHMLYHEGEFKPSIESMSENKSCNESADILYDIDTETHLIELHGGIVATDFSEHEVVEEWFQMERKMAQKLIQFL